MTCPYPKTVTERLCDLVPGDMVLFKDTRPILHAAEVDRERWFKFVGIETSRNGTKWVRFTCLAAYFPGDYVIPYTDPTAEYQVLKEV